MQSQSAKRVVSGALAAAAVFSTVAFAQSPAIAAPTPAPQTPPNQTPSEALQHYRDLANQASRVNEEYLQAQGDLAAKQGELDRANADMQTAHNNEQTALANQGIFRQDVDRFAGASFTSGAQLNKLSALLTGSSTQDFLDRSSALDVLAADKDAALNRLGGAVQQATDAQRAAADAQSRAQSAKDAAQQLSNDVAGRKQSLDDQVARAKAASDQLSPSDKAQQKDTGADPGNVKAPGAAAQAAINAALGKRGSPYVWGATGPDSFDCSGLTMWAYKQAGVSLGRNTHAQYQNGTPVSKDQLQPGDLVFSYGVEHVGIYIGNNQMVHAPTEGEPVKVSALQPLDGARRVA